MPQPVHAQHQMAPPDYGMGQQIPHEDFQQPSMYPGPVQGDPRAYGQQQMFDPGVYGAYPNGATAGKSLRFGDYLVVCLDFQLSGHGVL